MNRIKRLFDLSICTFFIIPLLFLILFLSLFLLVFQGRSIFFLQRRVGLKGKIFNIIKFRTMKINSEDSHGKNITLNNDPRITKIGKFYRKYKLDEFPAIYNVIKGDMSLVGPRPDVVGYADRLHGDSKKILEVRPGITGPASLKYANEESLFSHVDDFKKYNDEVIFPDKVKLNIKYIENWSMLDDIKIIFKTIFRRTY